MRDNIRVIFDKNIELIAETEKALIYFREERYDKALGLTAQVMEGLREVSKAVFSDREYFHTVSDEAVAEMLEGLLETRKSKDYVLLADLFELQLLPCLCSIQELVLKKEDYLEYDEENYRTRKGILKKKLLEGLETCEMDGDTRERYRVNQNALLDAELAPAELLSEGYRVEFTSCGRMTVGIRDWKNRNIYLHTNGRVSGEAFLLAKRWAEKKAETYLVYGLGMGYHIEELLYLVPEARLEVFESDMNIIKLWLAFSKIDLLTKDEGVALIYDPDGELLMQRLQKKKKKEYICVHYPSLCNVKNEDQRKLLSENIPWAKLVEQI